MDWKKTAEEITANRISKGFHTPENLETTDNRDMMLGKLMLVVTEVSEAAEAVRKGDLVNFKEELADAFIRLLDITETMGIDIETEIHEKHGINTRRPAGHGKLCTL
jgi:NTP pyrophosphatase (non-canonical NTP hydrolase)